MTTAQTIVSLALNQILNDDASQTPASSDLNLGLSTLQYLLDHLGLDPETTIGLQELTYTPTAGAQTVTIGATGNIVAAMPPYIDQSSSFQRLNGLDIPILWAANFDEYTRQPVKSNQGWLMKALYMPSNSNTGTLYLWPASNGSELHLFARTDMVSGYSSLTLSSTVTMGVGVQKVLIDILAAELLDSYNVPNPAYAQIKLKGYNSLRKFKRMNLRISQLKMPRGIGDGLRTMFTS